jgi:hypothetical protein
MRREKQTMLPIDKSMWPSHGRSAAKLLTKDEGEYHPR